MIEQDPRAVLQELVNALRPTIQQAGEAHRRVRGGHIKPEYERGRSHTLDDLHRCAAQQWSAAASFLAAEADRR